MAHYVNISKAEMEQVLFPQGFKALSLPGVSELVYGKRVDKDGFQLTLRVFTGINPSGESREVGSDAIRCTVFWRKDATMKMVGGTRRVHRVEGWRHNLQNRIDNIAEYVGPKCKCGCLMVERNGKNGRFYGCSTYPLCKETVSYDK